MTRGILVAPTEPGHLKILGRSSSIPERFGVDVYVPSLRLGVQRKQVNDFVASVVGDRLAKELFQMKQLVHRLVIVEGRFSWTADGEWLNGFQRFTLSQYRGTLYSIQELGVKVVETRDVRDTVDEIRHFIAWAGKDSHTSLESRPKTLVSKWGTRDSVDWQRWLLMGFEGIGAVQAKEIVKHFGEAPLKWKVTEKELQKVPGIGKVRAEKMMRALGNGQPHPSDALDVIAHEAEFYLKTAKSKAWRNHAQVILDAVKVLRA